MMPGVLRRGLVAGLVGALLPVLATAAAEADRTAVSDEPVELTELTSETFRVLAYPDGTFEAESSAEPVRVRRGTDWAPVDTTLVRRTDGVAPAAAAVDVVFSSGGDRRLVRLADGPASVGLDWPTPLPAPELSADKALYPNVLPDVDLVVQAGVEGFSSYLVVKNATAAANPALAEFSFPVLANEVTLAHTTEGGLAATDAQGRMVFDAPPARMWDSSEAQPENAVPVPPRDSFQAGVVRMGARETQARMAVASAKLTVTPDRDMLTSPDTVYPVVIDPALSKASQRKNWTMVWSNGYTFRNSPTEHARVGYDGWSGQNKKSRVFYQFDIAALRGKHILSAVFRARQIHSPHWNCDRVNEEPGVELWRTGATSKATTWNTQPVWQQFQSVNKMKKGHEDICGAPIDVEWNAEPAVEYAAASKLSVLTLGLRSANEGDKWGWRKYDNTSKLPVLTVRYNSPPTAPAGLSFADPKKQCEALLAFPPPLVPRPTLQATLTDPDRSGSLKARFEVYRKGTSDTLVWTGVPAAAVSPGQLVQIKVGVSLVSGGQYFFRVRGEESYTGYGVETGDASPWSANCDFSVDTVPPPPPEVTSTAYPPLNQAGTEYGGVGLSGAFTFKGRAADVRSYRYRLNAGSWQTITVAAGASAQVQITPDRQGVNLLRVISRDASGFDSEDTHYQFKVKPGAAPSRVWNLDETSGSTAADTSIYSTRYPLSVVTGASAPVWSSTVARSGSSLKLDGVDDYLTANQSVISTTASFTVTTWVRLSSVADNQAVVQQRRSDGRLTFLLYYSKAENRWGFQRANPDNPAAVATVFSHFSPPINGWTHLTATFDAANDQLRLYVNGVPQGAVDYPYSFDTTGTFEVGRWAYPGHSGIPLVARLDQMKLYNRVLAPEELVNLVRLPNTGGIPQPEMVGHWKFDETSGTSAADSSGYGSLATLDTGASLVADRERGRVLKVDATLAGRATTAGPQIDGSGSFTLMAWVRPDSAAQRGFVLTAGSHGVTPNGYETYGLGLSRDGPAQWVFTRRNHVNDPAARATVPSEVLEPDDYRQWEHVAAVYDSTTRRISLYRNGVRQLVGSGDLGVPFGAAWHSNGPIIIGSEVPGSPPTSGFSGLVDDVRAYSGAMTEGQIGLACDCWWTTDQSEPGEPE